MVNKVIVVVGGSRGLGKEMAKYCTQQGARVIILGRNETRLKICVNSRCCESYIICDVTLPQAVQAAFDTVLREYGQIDVLICNAAVNLPESPFLGRDIHGSHSELEALKKKLDVLQTNVEGLETVCFIAARRMVGQAVPGRIIIIGSHSGEHCNTYNATYGTSEAARGYFAKALRHQLYRYPINVTHLQLGALEEGMATEVSGRPEPQNCPRPGGDGLPYAKVCRTIEYLVGLGPDVAVPELKLQHREYKTGPVLYADRNAEFANSGGSSGDTKDELGLG